MGGAAGVELGRTRVLADGDPQGAGNSPLEFGRGSGRPLGLEQTFMSPGAGHGSPFGSYMPLGGAAPPAEVSMGLAPGDMTALLTPAAPMTGGGARGGGVPTTAYGRVLEIAQKR